MAFQKVSFAHLAPFNSAASSDLLDEYNRYIESKLLSKYREIPNRTFSPSAFRCDRRSWFKLRGVSPDDIAAVDRPLEFSAEIGTACHTILQTNLKELLNDRWIDVSKYVESLDTSSTYTCEIRDGGLETLISVDTPPVRFACDGLIELNGTIYLLEIKSSEYNSWNMLVEPKSQHIDQVNCYATLLQLNRVIFIYIDRLYGGLKCYEHVVSESAKQSIVERFKNVMSMVDKNIAPRGLPVGDAWCKPGYCPYYKKCQEYGR